MGNWLIPIFWVLVIGAVICFQLMKRSGNRKAAESGEDKQRVRAAAEPLLREGGSCLYAHWEERESYGRAVRTTYHRYAVTYQGQTLCVVPLYIEKKTRRMQLGQPSVFTTENLGKVIVKAKQKDGAAEHMEITLIGKQGETLSQFFAEAENYRKNRWYPVNIEQREECASFERFMTSLTQRVAAENPGIDDVISANFNEGVGIWGAIVSVIGAVLAIFLPPVGAVASVIGLIMSLVSKLKGAKGKIPLIISVICLIWSLGFIWMYLTIYF